MTAARGLVIVAATVLLSSACGDPVVEEQAVPEETASPDLGERPDLSSILTDEPGDPPGELVRDDVVPGDGEEARPGDTVTVQYVGIAWSTREEFDASWDRGQPLVFPLGAGRVIEGWDRGVEGMRVGGRRTLTIPPELGYGDRGVEGVIAPGETLVFVVDLLDVDRGA